MSENRRKYTAFNSVLCAAFLGLVFSLGFMQPSAQFAGYKLPLTDFVFLIVFPLWLVALLLKKVRLRRGWFYLPLILYLLALGCSTLFSSAPQKSFVKLLGEIYLVGLAVLTFNLVRTAEMCKRVVLVWLAASAVVSLVSAVTVFLFYFDRSNSFLEYTLHYYGSLAPGNYPRLQSTFIYPSMLCNYLTVSFLMLMASRKLAWIGRGAFVFLLFGLLIAVAFTVTPGIGGVFLGASLWTWLAFREKGERFFSNSTLVGGIAAAFAFVVVSAFTLRQIPTSPFYYNLPFLNLRVDPTQRLLAWQTALETFIKYPFFGKGLGLEPAAVTFLDPSGNMQFLTDAHQTWLSVAGQAGFFGLAALCFVCVFFVRRSLPLRFDGGEKSVLRLCFGIAFVSAFVYQGLFGAFEDARHLWILIGLLGSVGEDDF